MLLVALYIVPSPTAVKVRLPAISIVRLEPVNTILIDLVPVPVDPCNTSELPEPIELEVLSIVITLPPPEEVNDTLVLLLIVRLLIVRLTSTKMLALIFITTSWALVGTAFSDQFAAVFQLLLEDPSQ
jgi:hypothetical protein